MKRWMFAFAGLVLLAANPAIATADVEVITSPDQNATDINRTVLRALFAMRLRQWPDGTAVRVFVLPDEHPTHERFCRELLNTFPYVLRNTWERGVFTGTGFAPEQVGSPREMIEKVRKTRGAIGYVEREQKPGATAESGKPAASDTEGRR